METARTLSRMFTPALAVLGFCAAAMTTTEASAAKPAWCGDYESKGDKKARWIDNYIKSEGYTLRVVNYIAGAACDKPRAPARKKEVERWRQGYAGGILDDAQFAEAMAVYLYEDKYKEALKEQCAKYDGWKNRPWNEGIRDGALSSVVCGTPHQQDFILWNDWSGVSELDRVLMLSTALEGGRYTATASFYPWVAADLKALDLQKLEGEIAKMTPLERVKIRERAALLKVNSSAELEKDLAQTLKKNPAYKEVIDAADEGWKTWHATYKAHAATMDLGRNFECTFFADSDKVPQNCEEVLLQPLAAYMASRKPKDDDEAKAVASDMVSHRLLWDLVLCANLRENHIGAFAYQHTSLPQIWRGPRTAATNFARAKFVMNGWQGKTDGSPMAINGNFLPKIYDNAKWTAINAVHGYELVNHLAKVKTVKPSKQEGKNAVVFDKVRVKYREQNCKEDTSSWEVWNNQIRHPTVCELGAVRTRKHQEEPILVRSKISSEALPPKSFTTWVAVRKEYDGTPRDGFPLAIYADPEHEKLIGYFGIVW